MNVTKWRVGRKSMIALVSAISFSGIVQAGTIAWYRFEESPAGTRTTGESLIVNSIDPMKLVGRAYVQTPILWSGANQLLTPPELMPIYTNSFDSLLKVLDPVAEAGKVNSGALYMAAANNGSHESAGSTVLVADDAALHLKSLTVEFFVKIAPASYSGVERWFIEKRCNNEADLSWAVWFKQGTVYAGINTLKPDDSWGSYTVYEGYTNVNDGKWHHIALVVDDAAKKFRVIVDHAVTGLWCQEKSYEGELSYDNGGPVTFGPCIGRYYGIIEHTMDEVRISDRALGVGEFLKAIPRADASPVAETNTLVYLDFEGGGAPRTTEDFPTAVTVVPALQNKAPYHADFAVDAAAYVKSGVTNASPLAFPEDPAFSNTGSVGSDRFAPNTACAQTLTNAVDNDMTAVVVLPGTITRDMLFGGDVTIEFSFKMPMPSKKPPYEESCSSKNDSTHFACMLGGFQVMNGRGDSWDYGYLRCTVGTTSLSGVWQDHPTLVPKDCADGLWHHCALTYDHVQNHAEFFLDGVLRLSADDIVFPDVGSIWSGFRREFMVGGTYYDTWYTKNLKYDDVRITRGVLAPSQFLSESYPADVNGTQMFMSLQEAIEAAAEGDVVNLRRNETIVGNGLLVNGKANLTIDLKGHVLHCSPTGYVLDVEGSTLTITNSVGEGCIAKDTQTTVVQVGKTSVATLTLAGGIVLFAGENPIAENPSMQADGSCISVRNYGRFTMTGGELDNGGDANEWAIRASDGGVAEFAGGVVKGGVQPNTSAGAVRIVKASETLFDENPLSAEPGKVIIHSKYHMEQVGGEGEYSSYWHAVRNPREGMSFIVR